MHQIIFKPRCYCGQGKRAQNLFIGLQQQDKRAFAFFHIFIKQFIYFIMQVHGPPFNNLNQCAMEKNNISTPIKTGLHSQSVLPANIEATIVLEQDVDDFVAVEQQVVLDVSGRAS